MKLKTSYSKLTTFRKDITRFAPIWALYLIGLLLVLVDIVSYSEYDRLASDIPEIIMSFGVVNLLYAAVCAVMLFGDLYNTRMCYSLHTQPARRESLLLSHLAAGILFSLVPNGVAALYMMARLEEYWFLALYWLLACQMQFVFFFGVAAFSALLTGNRFAMLLVYAGINFVSILAYWIVDTIYLPNMTGVVLDFDSFGRFCPVVDLFSSWSFLEFERYSVVSDPIYGYSETHYRYLGLGDGWGYLAILLGIGVLMMAAAMLLYRLRHLENAGDFVAFPKLKNVACVVMTVCVGGVFAFVGGDMFGSSMLLWLAVGLVIGYFGSLMLLERRVKVFRAKSFIGFGVLAAVLTGSFLLVAYDVFGIESWLPRAEKVKSVTVANFNADSYYYDYYYGNRISVTLQDQAQIEEIIEAHRDILDRLDQDTDSAHRVVLTYKLESGRTVKRSYIAPANGVNYEIIRRYLFTPQQILGYTDWDSYVQSVFFMCTKDGEIPRVLYEPMLSALRSDCEAGTVIAENSKGAEQYVTIQTEDINGGAYRELYILEGAEKTMAILKSPEMILGCNEWDSYEDCVQSLMVNHSSIQREDYAALIEALRKDAENGAILLGESGEYIVEIELCYPDGSWAYRNLGVNKEAANTYNWIGEKRDSA